MYAVLYITDSNVGALDEMLNEKAVEGYRWVGAFRSASRYAIVMEKTPEPRGRGRPRKIDDDESGMLGE